MSRLIMEQQQTAAFERYGAFFAFSDKQLKEKRVKGIKYVSLFSGLIAPKDNAKRLLEELEAITDNYIKRDIEENGIKKILWREFANYECQIVGSPKDAIDALENYHIDKKTIQEEWVNYWNWCVDNDNF